MTGSAQDQRKIYIDLLRILACFSVVMLHCAAQYWYDLPIESREWQICNAYDALFRFGVPIFVMISGMLFLGNGGQIDIKKLYQKNILRLLAVYLVWSSVYGLWGIRGLFGTGELTFTKCMEAIVQGRYHLWFLPMLIGIYMLLPVLKTWVDHGEKRQIEYFLILFLIFQILVQTVAVLPLPVVAQAILAKMEIPLACSYVGYFVLGYYLFCFPPEKKRLRIIYLAGVAGAAGALFGSMRLARYYGKPSGGIFDSFSICTLGVSVALFLLFQEQISKIRFSCRMSKIIQRVSADTLGIYLVHIGLLEILQMYGIDTMRIGNYAGIPLMAVGCFVLGMLIAAILRRIPVVGKYIC